MMRPGNIFFKDTDGTDGGARGEARTLEKSRWEYGGLSVAYECYEDSGQIHRIITWQNPKTETCMWYNLGWGYHFPGGNVSICADDPG